jgi:hypothetical protein
LIGLIAIEFALRKLKRMQNIDEKRDSQFPAFRRRDAANWSRWKFYPGAMLCFPFRFISLIL